MARKVAAQQLSLPGLETAATEPERPPSTTAATPPNGATVTRSRPLPQPATPPQPDATAAVLLTTREAALRLHVHPRTVQRLVERGELPAIHIGAAVRFDPADVSELTTGSRYVAHAAPAPVAERVRAAHAARVTFADRLRSRSHEHRADHA